jgi:CHAT domain-containing protein
VALNNKSDIEEMVKLSRQVIELSPVAHYGRGEFLGQLGYSLLLQTMGQGPAKSRDRDEGLLLIRQALEYKETPAVIRLLYCHEALIHCMTNDKWEEGLAIADMGMRIMPELILRSQQNMDRQRSLRRFSGIASFAAAFALQLGRDPVEALVFLESGRGLLIASLEELRSDIRGLQDAHRDLADQFEHLRSQLDGEASLSNNTMSLETFKEAVLTNSSPTRTDQRHLAEQALDELLIKIRRKPGFEDFLQVTPSEQAMRHAAKEGPIVVINVNELRCDAIIIEESQIRHVPLPKLKWKDVKTSANRGQELSVDTLEWLWDCIACPVLEMLGFSQTPSAGQWPRIWWIPTGALSTLPLHAAGLDSSHSSDTVLDRVMSSYSPSIKAIIHGRKRQLSLPTEASKDRAILVAMEHTPNAPSLPFAPGEVKIVRKLSQSLGLMSVEPASTLEQVSNELRQCKIFHFAGHGSTDATDPSRSHLLLQEGRAKSLTVAALMDMNLQKESPPFLAYLSACGTGRIKDAQLFDESVHLISGFQLAGFRHVIGTLWEVNDETCVHMAKLVYEGLQKGGLTDESVCLALHNATRVLRGRWHDMVVSRGNDLVPEAEDKKSQVEGHNVERGEALSRDIVPFDDDEEQRGEPLLWATYVHFGV